MGFDFDKALNVAEQLIGTGKNLAALKGIYDPDEKIIQRPRGIRVQQAHFTDAAWITIQPKVLISQAKSARGIDATKSTKSIVENGKKVDLPLFKFLAPNEIQENIVHQWEPYESIVTRLLQKGVDAYRIASDVETVYRPTERAVKDIVSKVQKGTISAADIKTNVANIVGSMTRSTVPRNKLDTPLVFQDSTRRQYTLTFWLIDEGNTYKDVVYPVKQLEWYSSASYGGRGKEHIGFDPPYIFEVTTSPGDKLVYMKNAALTSIQPIYRQPYRQGYPSVCELTLTFTEIEPMYKRQVEQSQQATVTVSITPGVSISLGQTQDLSVEGISGRKWADRFKNSGISKKITSIAGGG